MKRYSGGVKTSMTARHDSMTYRTTSGLMNLKESWLPEVFLSFKRMASLSLS